MLDENNFFNVKGYTYEEQVDAEEGFLIGKYQYDNTSNEIIQFFNVQVVFKIRTRFALSC